MNHGYIFLTRDVDRRVVIDSWLDASEHVGTKAIAAQVRRRMLHEPPPDAKAFARNVQLLKLRAQFNNDMLGPSLVKVDEPMSPQDFELYLNSMSYPEYKTFMRNARI
jgi:hypothetical protein